MTSHQAGTQGAPREILAWFFAGLAILYAFVVYHGIGPVPVGAELAWYEPRGWFFKTSALVWALESSRRIIILFTLPAVALTIATFLAGRSALARALAISSVVCSLLFCFYGDVASQVWEFFHWRGSAVITLTGIALGFALAAPFLAESWLRLSWPLRAVTYFPALALVLGFIRNATGTDESLRFSISPWPAISVFGIEVGALFVMLWMLAAALAAWGVTLARERGKPLLGVAGIVAGILAPLGLMSLGSALSLLPFRSTAGTLGTTAVICSIGIALACTVRVLGRDGALRRRATNLAVGTALIAVPLMGGQAWARWDYYVTREHRAMEIINALEAYYAHEEVYPGTLDDLVKAGHIDEIPTPDIGFGFLYDGKFRYRDFGMSYILEFPAPRWVECAYSPPYADEDEDEEEVAYEEEDDEKEYGSSEAHDGWAEMEDDDGSWSCPSKPPELW